MTATKKCGAWAKVWGEQPHFPFSGQPDTNIGLAHPNNELKYFELSIRPQIIELISTETTCNAQHFLENMPNSKISLKVHHRHDTIMLLAFLLLQGTDQKPDNKCCFSKRKILATTTLWNSL